IATLRHPSVSASPEMRGNRRGRKRMLARRAVLVTVAALGLVAGLGATLLIRGDHHAASRRVEPSVRRFRFPSGGSGVISAPAAPASVAEPARARDALAAFL